MGSDDDVERLVEACLAAAEHVNRSGSSELRAAMRVLLFALGTMVAEQVAEDRREDDPKARTAH